MKIVYNKWLPFPGFFACTVINRILIRYENRRYEGTPAFEKMLNHEQIHYEQLLDFTLEECPLIIRHVVGALCFYSFYLLEWLFKLIPALLLHKNAYRSISFEQEAYQHENDPTYPLLREKWGWKDKIFKLTK